jgi:hypothetical protein
MRLLPSARTSASAVAREKQNAVPVQDTPLDHVSFLKVLLKPLRIKSIAASDPSSYVNFGGAKSGA